MLSLHTSGILSLSIRHYYHILVVPHIDLAIGTQPHALADAEPHFLGVEMFSTMEFFLMIRVYKEYWNKFSLVAQASTLGNFLNFHKRKMAADRYRRFLILEPFVLTASVVPRWRVVSFVESSFYVSFWCQGQRNALKVNECQVCVGTRCNGVEWVQQ